MIFKKQKPLEGPRRNMVRQRSGQAPAGRGPVFSYHASRSQRQDVMGRVAPDKAERIKLWQERLRWLKSAPRLLLLAAIVIVGALMLRLDSHATVVPLDESQGQVFLRSLKTYEDAVQRVFSSSYINNNKVTVDTARIIADVKKQFPELRTVTISLPLTGSRPVVYIQPAVPALILSTKASGIYVVDSSGKALITGNQVPALERLKLPVVTDESGISVTAGTVVLSQQSVVFISEVAGQLRAKGIDVTSLTLPAESSELHIRVSGASYYTKYNLHGNAREEAGTFLAVKQRLETDKKQPQEYIDVRVPGRVYYR